MNFKTCSHKTILLNKESKENTFDKPALMRGSKLETPGAGCLLNKAHSGNSSSILCATEQLANNINSSTIELVSLWIT